MKFYFHVWISVDWIFNRSIGRMFLLIAILPVYFASVLLSVLHTVQFTIDLPAQILVTRIRKHVSKSLISILLILLRDSVAPSRVFPTASRHWCWKSSRSLDFLKENVSLVIYPVTKAIWKYAISSLEIEGEEIVRTDVPMRKFTFNLLLRYYF